MNPFEFLMSATLSLFQDPATAPYEANRHDPIPGIRAREEILIERDVRSQLNSAGKLNKTEAASSTICGFCESPK